MKKSTEKKRLKRMNFDTRRLFLNGLITGATWIQITKALQQAEKKLR